MSTQSQERYDVYATFTTSFSQKEALGQAALDRGVASRPLFARRCGRISIGRENEREDTRNAHHSLYLHFKKWFERAGLPQTIKMHELRRSAADNLWRETGKHASRTATAPPRVRRYDAGLPASEP